MPDFLNVSDSLSNFIFVASADPHFIAYGGLALAHSFAAWINWRHRHINHATIYASCGCLYSWLLVLSFTY